jgi:hypothetical protein
MVSPSSGIPYPVTFILGQRGGAFAIHFYLPCPAALVTLFFPILPT